jgi:two-component system sensor histidine kinase CpxA
MFVKTLLWFLATTAVALFGFTVTTAFTFTASESSRSPFFMLMNVQVEDAKKAYETGGQAALANVLAHFRSVTQAEVVLTDADGKDLLTGQVRPEFKRRIELRGRGRMGRQPPPPSLFPPFYRPVIIARPDSTRQYWLFLVEPRRNSVYWFLQPQHLWIIGLVTLLCYGFSYHLTSPVRRLQKTVVRFGEGDFSARSDMHRRDELGRLSNSFNQMADRIQTLLKAERRLLQDISHELRSPLARLGVAIELARSGEDREATLDRIQREADRINALVGELLQVTRAEGDPTQQKHELVQLDESVGEVVSYCDIEAQAKECELKLTVERPLAVSGDEELLRRAVENVLRNAIRYAPVHTAIEVELRPAGANAQIRIRDYGPGVPEESLTRIFDAFYRVDTDRNRGSGGVGLGLAIARRAIQLHNGSLHAENARPGLLVVIELPLTAVARDSGKLDAPALVTKL